MSKLLFLYGIRLVADDDDYMHGWGKIRTIYAFIRLKGTQLKGFMIIPTSSPHIESRISITGSLNNGKLKLNGEFAGGNEHYELQYTGNGPEYSGIFWRGVATNSHKATCIIREPQEADLVILSAQDRQVLGLG